jgi:hypothetical protein
MRTTIDIPDEIYRAIRIEAAERGTSVRQIVLDGLEAVRQKKLIARKDFSPPLIPSTRTDKLVLDNETIYDLIEFP